MAKKQSWKQFYKGYTINVDRSAKYWRQASTFSGNIEIGTRIGIISDESGNYSFRSANAVFKAAQKQIDKML